MTSKERQQVFDKTGGKCAYCGCELNKGWHVDHADPVKRYPIVQRESYRHKGNGSQVPAYLFSTMHRHDSNFNSDDWQYVPRSVRIECHHPERDHMDNWLPACASCNINKGGSDVETFRMTLTRGVASLEKQHAQYRMAKRFGLIKETGIEVKFYFETL